jgi:chromatin remodeling complex protein RSC6
MGIPAIPLETITVPETAADKAEAPAKTRKAGPGLSKPMTPSPELAAIVGPGPMPRTEVVAKVWDHIRAHGLQDPANKQTIVADDKLKAVFGKDRATMFEMQRLLSPHLTAA